jgi:acetyl esterase/lipase
LRSLSFWRDAAVNGAGGAHALLRRAADAFGDIGASLRIKKSRALWRRWALRSLMAIAAILICLYLGMAALLYVAQRSMMYFPEAIHTTPAQAHLPEAQEITLTASDGVRILAWYAPPRDDKPVIIYFHGNGGALRYRVEYRGYGGSSGSPSESGLIADGQAAYAFAAARYKPQQLVLWGESLGSGVAVAIAADNPVGRVILEAPFTSAAAVAARRYWYMPVWLLMKDQYRSDERIGKITAANSDPPRRARPRRSVCHGRADVRIDQCAQAYRALYRRRS